MTAGQDRARLTSTFRRKPPQEASGPIPEGYEAVSSDDSEANFEYLGELAREADREASSSGDDSKKWERRNLWIGIPAALFAGAGGVTALTDVGGGWKILAAILAVSGGSLAGVATTLNASRKAEDARLRALSLRALAREAEILARLDRQRFASQESRMAIDDLVSWLNEINGLPARKSPYRRWVERHPGDTLT